MLSNPVPFCCFFWLRSKLLGSAYPNRERVTQSYEDDEMELTGGPVRSSRPHVVFMVQIYEVCTVQQAFC